jgi:hypothetical protein
MHSGQDFVKHEFDEAIAVQQSIVRGATELARIHPMPDSKRELQSAARESEQWLRRLQESGSKFGATGEKEDVASGIEQLAMTTLEKARDGEPSEVYEAQAVVINALRKQQDSAGSIVKIATSMRDRELAAEGREMQRATKKTADGLARNLTQLAVFIATEGRETGTRGGARAGGSRSTGGRSSSSSRGSSSRGAAGRTAAASRGGQKSSSSRSSGTRSSAGSGRSSGGGS